MNKRLDDVRNKIKESGLDGLLVSSLENIRYISGFTSDEAYLLLTAQEAFIFTDFRYFIQAREQSPEFQLVEINNTNVYETIRTYFRDLNLQSCGFEENKVTFSEYQALKLYDKLVPASKLFVSLRILKDENEKEYLKKAQSIADQAYAKLLTIVHSGMTEKEVAAELDYIGLKLGSERPSFDTIVGSGPNGAKCHAVCSDRKLQKGDLVVVDFGCTYNGYHSDMTRTFAVQSIDDELKKIYDIVLQAQLRSLECLSNGVSGRELDAVARDYISSKGYGECFGHSLGHGFGLEIHEPPRASVSSDDILKSGMTITIEPGIYIDGKGGVRIEDCCMVTDDGKINFVSTNKELVFIA